MSKKQTQSLVEQVGTDDAAAKLTDDELMAVAGGAGLDSDVVKKQMQGGQTIVKGSNELGAPVDIQLLNQ